MKYNKQSIKRILKEEINEYIDMTYDEFTSKDNKMPIVYQLAFRDRVPSIFKNGYSREYAGTAGGNFYCRGVYSTFDLASTIRNSKTKTQIYGDTIIKIGVKSYDRFFICDMKIAKETYGKHYRLEDQLDMLFADYPKILNKIKQSKDYKSIIDPTVDKEAERYTSQNVQKLLMLLNGMHCLSDKMLNEIDIRGFIFHGGGDGKVVIIRDFKAIVPLAYSTDNGKTWKTDLSTRDSYEKIANDYDPIIFLGKDASKYINPKRYRLINGYMKVQRKDNHLYNFIDVNKNILSPMWFKQASDMNENKMAFVMDGDGYTFYVGEDGYYENENDDYPFMTFDEV